MSHRINERLIFAFLDGRLSANKEKRFKEHLQTCSKCSARLKQLEGLTSAAKEAFAVEEPDWTSTDRSVERAISELDARKSARGGWAPAALTLAAATAVALAIALPVKTRSPSDSMDQSGLLHVVMQSLETVRAMETIAATVVDTIIPGEEPRIGQTIDCGDEVVTSDCGSVRIALGEDALLETGPTSGMELICLDSESPAVEILDGRLVVSVKRPSFGYERGLAVLAGGSGFNVLSGIVEFIYGGDSLTVNVMDGEVIADKTFGGATLVPGVWVARKSNESRQWLPIQGLGEMRVGDLAGLSPVDEQRPQGAQSGGTIPVHLVKESLAAVRPKIRDCYETALKRDPRLTLTVDVNIAVGLAGSVTSVKAVGLERVPQMKRCVESVLEGVRFPRPKGGSVEVVYPLRLYPEN